MKGRKKEAENVLKVDDKKNLKQGEDADIVLKNFTRGELDHKSSRVSICSAAKCSISTFGGLEFRRAREIPCFETLA